MKLSRDFYKKSSIQLSQDLLGKIFVNIIHGKKISCRIVEVEAYMGVEDKAAHSYRGKRTKRTEVMYGKSGLLYVFIVYGMYNCANIVAAEEDVPQAVLIRAVEPLEGIEEMAIRRFNKQYSELSEKEKINLTNGPGKLCIAMGIDRTANGEDLCLDNLYLEEDGYKSEVVTSKRIGIDYAEEAVDLLYRFYLKDNNYVSVK
jgi:DNA-3-methyladenine glycosylase